MDKPLALRFALADLELILNVLAAQPYARVATLIHDIQAQAARQVPAPAPVPMEEDR
jgi:hypothetical protein